MIAPHATRARILALALLIAVAIMAALAIGWPYRQLAQRLETRIEMAHLALQRERAAAERLPRLRQALRQRDQRTAGTERLLLDAQTAALAQADLQQRLKAALQANGAQPVSLQAVDIAPWRQLQRIGVSAVFTADTPILQKVLHALESGIPAVAVEKLYVRVRDGRSDAQYPLDVTLQVTGLWQPGGGG